MTRHEQVIALSLLLGLSTTSFAKEKGHLSLNDLLNIKVVSATKNGVSVSKAPATIYAVLSSIIQSRGYQTVQSVGKPKL